MYLAKVISRWLTYNVYGVGSTYIIAFYLPMYEKTR